MRIFPNTTGLMATPIPADIAREHAEALGTLDFDKVITALPDVVDQAMRTALPERYTPELAQQIAQATIVELRNPQQDEPADCPVWPGLCTDTTPGHYDHYNHQHQVTDKRGEPLLAAGFIQFSDDEFGASFPVVYIGGEDYDPSEVREKTAELRRLLDQADEMADKVTALRA